MKPIEVADNIFWVGAVDWNVRDFHGYSTECGSTYNAFLILDDKVTLIDAVKAPFTDDLLAKISTLIDPRKIDIVVSNHTEMDHSGGLPRVMHRIGADKPIYCSKMGKKNLTMHHGDGYNYQPVEDGGTLSIGKRTLTFLETRMLHWPDSMFTYLPEDKILFSSDAFGQHYAGLERFDDELGDAVWHHAEKYFANILLLYAPLIPRLLKKVTDLGLEFDMILPDHGILWRKDPMAIVKAYAQWAEQKPANRAVVFYDSMWHSTEAMAEAIVSGLGEEGVSARPMNLRVDHRSDVITEVMKAGLVVGGSPTLNNGLFPTVSDFMTYMKGLKPQNKLGAAFGSFGWSGEAPKLVQETLEGMGFAMPEPPLRVQYVPGDKALEDCANFGRRLAKNLAAHVKSFEE